MILGGPEEPHRKRPPSLYPDHESPCRSEPAWLCPADAQMVYLILPLRPEQGVDHFPWATLALMAVCLLMFLATVFEVIAEPRALYLVYGELNPLQWFTCAVMHGDWVHIIGNMFFLYVFGVVVEGLVGTPLFMALVATAVAAQGLFVQFLMLNFEWGPEALAVWASKGVLDPPPQAACGASGFVSAIMVSVMIWAPSSRITYLWMVGFRGRVSSISILALVVIYLVFNVWHALWNKSPGVTTEWAHLIGAAIGGLLAWWLLAAGWIATDGWELFGRKRHRRGL
jgi:membrane associated rhomboid family serine protease